MRITIDFNLNRNGNLAWKKYGCMWEREILDKFSSKWYKKLKVCPKRIDGNFIILNLWINNKKQFNKNAKMQRIAFWEDFKKVCKRNKISYTESCN